MSSTLLRGAHLRTSSVAVALAVGSAAVLSACGDSASAGNDSDEATVTVTHAQGETPVPVNPETVVTLDHAVLDSLDALDVPVTGVVQSGLPEFLSEYASDEYEPVGALKEPDLEAIAAIDPDVIFISGRSAGFYEDLSEIAPTVDMTTTSTDFMDALEEANGILGQIFDKEDEVEAKLADIQARADAIAEKNSNGPTALVALVSGGKVSAYGAGSRFGAVHDALGFAEAAEGLKQDTHGQAVSFEFIKETNPEWLFVVDRDAAIGQAGKAAEQVLDNALVNATTAVQQDQVVYLDGGRWYLVGGGLNNAIEMLKPIEDALDQ